MATTPVTFTVTSNAEKSLTFDIVNKKTNKKIQNATITKIDNSTVQVRLVPIPFFVSRASVG
jgi:hypothetical protein